MSTVRLADEPAAVSPVRPRRVQVGPQVEATSLFRSRHLGLNFEAPFAIGEACSEDARVDVSVRTGPSRPVPDDEPGPIVAELNPWNSAGYAVYYVGRKYVFRFHGLCEFEVSEDGVSVTFHPGPSCPEGLSQVLLEGTLAAWLLTLRGFAVLHASVLRWKNATIVIAGHSGRGKSTVAALCCAAGAELVADDVAALRVDPDGIACTGLGRELRLRPQAFGIADLFSPPLEGRTTPDGRLAIRPGRAADEHNLVTTVLLPSPARDSSEVTTRRLAPGPAVMNLLANARIGGMVPTGMQRTYFETVSALATSVPVIEARVPWGPPFALEVAQELLSQTAASA